MWGMGSFVGGAGGILVEGFAVLQDGEGDTGVGGVLSTEERIQPCGKLRGGGNESSRSGKNILT